MDVLRTYQDGKRLVSVYFDHPEDGPRDWDNLGTMWCWHKRYELGDSDAKSRSSKPSSASYNGWDEMEEAIRRDFGAAIILPLYLMDHSGLSISTRSFNDRWDSGQVGFVWVSREAVCKEYNVKRLTKKVRERAQACLEAEVRTYDQYLRGDVYGFITTVDGEEIDSCWGFYGSDDEASGLLEHAGIEKRKAV